MQGIGIIPEAGSLAGAPAAQSGGSAAADGFLALLASLNGGAGLLVQPHQRAAQGKAAVTPTETPQGLQPGPATGKTGETNLVPNNSAEPTQVDPTAQLGAATQAAANSAQASSPQVALAKQPATAAALQGGPQPGPLPTVPPAQANPLSPAAGQPGKPTAPANSQAQANPTAAPTGPATPTQPTRAAPTNAGHGQSTEALASSAGNAKPAHRAQTPLHSQVPITTDQAAAPKAPLIQARTEPAALPASNGTPAAQATALTPEAQNAAASTAPATASLRNMGKQTSDKPVEPLGPTAKDHSSAAPQESARSERTLVASTHPNATAAANKAARTAQATQPAGEQANANVKSAATDGAQSAQTAQQSPRPTLWSAALANAQLLASIDQDIFMPGSGASATGVEPLIGPTSLANAKAGSDGYGASANRLAYLPPSDQVAVQIQRAISAQAQRFSIRLEPAELGRIDVRLDFARDGNLRAAITVERPETFDLLQRDIQNLERSLKESGVQSEGLKLDLQLGEGGGERREASNEGLTSSERSESGDDETADLPDLAAIAPPRAVTGLLDIVA